MMRKRALLTAVAITSAHYLFAQTAQMEKETWADKPTIHNIDSKYAREAGVTIFDKHIVEYVDESKDELAEYYTTHKIIHINDDRGLESFNKIYLGLSENSDIVDVHARS